MIFVAISLLLSLDVDVNKPVFYLSSDVVLNHVITDHTPGLSHHDLGTGTANSSQLVHNVPDFIPFSLILS